MKGIILAGGLGTRLYPLTKTISKQMLPVFNKPMIYYPLCTLLELGIKDIILISSPNQIGQFQDLLGDGTKWGITIEYVVQPSPDGLAQAFILCEEQIKNEDCCLVLGDNIFHTRDFSTEIAEHFLRDRGCQIFVYEVSDPERYGVVNFQDGKIVDIEEKPEQPKSNLAITGLYFFDDTVAERAKTLSSSPRGELEITDLIKTYLDDDYCRHHSLSLGTAWLDTGTFSSLIEAASYIQTLENRQGILIGCPEQIVYKKNYINAVQYEKLMAQYNLGDNKRHYQAV